jgi:hypothetical protein
MALTYDLRSTPWSAWGEKKKDKRWSVVNGLIHLTMMLDFTMEKGEKDIDEFLWRARCYELASGAYFTIPCKEHAKVKDCDGHTDPATGVSSHHGKQFPVPITREMVEPLAGMSTNVIRLSRAKWLTKMKNILKHNTDDSFRREKDRKK